MKALWLKRRLQIDGEAVRWNMRLWVEEEALWLRRRLRMMM